MCIVIKAGTFYCILIKDVTFYCTFITINMSLKPAQLRHFKIIDVGYEMKACNFLGINDVQIRKLFKCGRTFNF